MAASPAQVGVENFGFWLGPGCAGVEPGACIGGSEYFETKKGEKALRANLMEVIPHLEKLFRGNGTRFVMSELAGRSSIQMKAQELGIEDADPASLAEHPKVHERIQGILDEVNRNYAQVEQVKKFTILDHDLSQETGELTPTLKVKRNVVHEKFADVVDRIYAAPR